MEKILLFSLFGILAFIIISCFIVKFFNFIMNSYKVKKMPEDEIRVINDAKKSVDKDVEDSKKEGFKAFNC